MCGFVLDRPDIPVCMFELSLPSSREGCERHGTVGLSHMELKMCMKDNLLDFLPSVHKMTWRAIQPMVWAASHLFAKLK